MNLIGRTKSAAKKATIAAAYLQSFGLTRLDSTLSGTPNSQIYIHTDREIERARENKQAMSKLLLWLFFLMICLLFRNRLGCTREQECKWIGILICFIDRCYFILCVSFRILFFVRRKSVFLSLVAKPPDYFACVLDFVQAFITYTYTHRSNGFFYSALFL